MTELETLKRAKMYMDKLSQGIDPITDTEIEGDSCLNNVRMARCFFYISGVLDRLIAKGGFEPKAKKLDFSVSIEQLERITISSVPVRITEFVDMVYRAADNPAMKKPGTTAFTGWLLKKGFMELVTGPDGKQQRLPTPAGRSLGISADKRQGQYGEYTAVYYNADAQRFMLDNIEAIFEEK